MHTMGDAMRSIAAKAASGTGRPAGRCYRIVAEVDLSGMPRPEADWAAMALESRVRAACRHYFMDEPVSRWALKVRREPA